MKLFYLFIIFFLMGCSFNQTQKNTFENEKKTSTIMISSNDSTTAINLDTATFGAGCFWCIEAAFIDVKGVVSVQSGYCGGHVKNPTYKEVCSGLTGHAEVAQIVYDATILSFDELLEMFWKVHDPTQLNKQGNDIGTQYRSAIFYHNELQKTKAKHYKNELNNSGAWDKPIVTEIVEMSTFYPAEDYHNNYFALHPEEQYCKFVVGPKVEKFKKVFADKMK